MQTLLYLRRPFSPRKKAHSSRHFLLRLIGHAPGASSGGLCPGACARRTPAWPPPADPGWRAFSPAWSCAPHPSPPPINHPVVVLHGHLCGAKGVLRFHRQGDDLPVQVNELLRLLEVFHSLSYSVYSCSCAAASFSREKLSSLIMCSIRQASASAVLGSTPAAISCSVKKQWRS